MEQRRRHTPSLDFVGRMDQILNRPLTVNTIDSYAEHALNEVIELIESAEDAYSHQPTIAQPTHAAAEDAALHYYGLNGAAEVLDHLSEKDAELRAIDQRIAAVATSHLVIVPPDMHLSGPNRASESTESYKQPKNQARLKTVLFLLANEFEVALDNPDEVMITEGSVGSTMMRQLPYYEVVVPSLNRTILVCDEYGNATYVFDTQKTEQLLQQQNSTDLLCNRTKRDLAALIDQRPDCGTVLRANKHFVTNLIGELTKIKSQWWMVPRANYLDPRRSQTDDYKSIDRAARDLGVHRRAVDYALQCLEEERAGDVITSSRGTLLTREQIALVRQSLTERGYFRLPPTDYHVSYDIARAIGVSHRITTQVIEELKQEQLITGIHCRQKGAKLGKYYSPTEQEIIRQRAIDHGYIVPQAPEGYMTIMEASERLGIRFESVQHNAKKLGIVIKKYRAIDGYRPMFCLSPEQFSQIQHYREKHLNPPVEHKSSSQEG